MSLTSDVATLFEPLRLDALALKNRIVVAPMKGDPEPGSECRLSDYEMPGKLPGLIKDLMGTGWMDGNMRRVFQDFKALAEAKVPAHA